jgi:DNA modification methylase
MMNSNFDGALVATGSGWDVGEHFATVNGDCVERLRDIAPGSVDLAVFSPPFSSLYAYTNADADMGNSRESDDEFLLHYEFFCDAIAPTIKPGRNVVVHLQQVSRFKVHHGYMGLFDIRGEVIRLMERSGLHYYGDVTVDKCPQAQAIRTKSNTLTFTQFEKDSMVSRPALADYLLIFKAPGDNAVPVRPEASREEWIQWARPLWREVPGAEDIPGLTEMYEKGQPYPLWRDIKETDTLNVKAARSANDERHVCPLQLPLIDRVVRLWSNPGEVVLSPFMGVGSEGYQALKRRRRFIGIELNPRYYDVARRNLAQVVDTRDRQRSLFSFGGV